jgi:hypothetical protein
MGNIKKLKISKKQYDRIFANGVINETSVKGGLNRVNNEFKKQTQGRGIKITNEGVLDSNDLSQEVNKLLQFLYRESNVLSTFWEENGVEYNDIISKLENAKLITSKNGLYSVNKIGSAEEVKDKIKAELQSMLSNGKMELEEDDYSMNSVPENDNRVDITNNSDFKVITTNDEFSVVKTNNGELFIFDYLAIDREKFKEYSERQVLDKYPNTDGGYDIDYDDDFEIDYNSISGFLNDNYGKVNTGEGLNDWESGSFPLVKVDEELKDFIKNMYDKNEAVINSLTEMDDEGLMDTSPMFKQDNQRAFDLPKNPIDKERISLKLNAIRAKELARRDLEKTSDEELDEMSSTGSVGGSYTASFGGENVMRKSMPNTPIIREENDLGKGYTHFAIFKSDTKIANGWDYSSLYDKDSKSYDDNSVLEYAREDMLNDFPDNKLSDFKIVTLNYLNKKGINSNDTNNWYKYNLDESDIAGAGNFDYDSPGGLTMDLGKNNAKSKAEKKTQYAGGSFVEFNDCTKLNNKVASTGCSSGAVDNVVKLKKTNGNINAPSLHESKILQLIAKKTGKSVRQVMNIVNKKNK